MPEVKNMFGADVAHIAERQVLVEVAAFIVAVVIVAIVIIVARRIGAFVFFHCNPVPMGFLFQQRQVLNNGKNHAGQENKNKYEAEFFQRKQS